MADISKELNDILQAVYGEEVRGSIHDAIELINLVNEAGFNTGTAVTGASSSITGYYKDSVYFNTSTFDVWKCNGTAWVLQANLIGNGIDHIAKTGTNGFQDTYTIYFTKGESFSYIVTNGKGIVNILKTETNVLTDTYRITYNDSTYTDYTVVNGNGISNIQKTGTNVLVDTYTISFTNGTTSTFTVTNGAGIAQIQKTGTVGLVDTYTVYLSDNTTATFTVTNGVGLSGFEKSSSGLVDTYTLQKNDGTNYSFSVTNGKGISGHVKQGTDGLIDTYRMTYNDGTYFDYTVTNGKGISSFVLTDDTTLAKEYTITYNDGTTQTITITDGTGISGISKTSTEGLVDTYTISYTNGTSTTFTVKNGYSPTVEVSKTGKVATIIITDEEGPHTFTVRDGNDGSGAGDMLKETYDADDDGIVDEAASVEWDGVQNVPYDNVPTAGSENLMQSQHIKAALDSKGDTLVYDDVTNRLNLMSGGAQGTVLSFVEIEGGGSLKLADVSGASISSNMTNVSLTWSDPSDITIDGQVVARWGGTLVVRKAGSAPANRNDGTVIVDNKTRNQYSSTAYIDNTVEYGTTYYYRFFPYTSDNVYTNGSSVSVTPGRINIEHVPLQSGTLTYDGTEQTASFTYYDSDKMTVEGNTGTNAGSYTATFTPKEGYCWSDGTLTGKDVTWIIGNAVIDAVPHITSALIYTGSEITPTWADYDPDKLTKSGAVSGTNIGDYTTIFTPKTNYEWYDGTTTAKEVNWSIVYESIENVPVQTGTLTYDGTEQSPTWLYFDGTKMTKTETAQTNAGTYQTIFTPLTGYSWPDSTTGQKTINWTIAKATLTIPTLNAYDLTYDGTSKGVTFANFDSTKMTKSGDSAIDAGNHTAIISISDAVNYEWTDHTIVSQSYNWTIAKATLTIPTVGSETLTYTGSEQTRNFNNYSSATMDVSGNTGTNAGDYTATFSLKDTDNYQWYGGSIADQDVSWSIAKATQTITPQSASVTLDADHTSVQIGLTQTGDGAVTASTSNSSVATASVSGSILTISSVNNTSGSATITLNAAATTNYDAASATVTVTAQFTTATIYGFHIDGDESDPEDAVTYLEGAVGKTPAHMDYTQDEFNYGSWENAFFMPRPCMLKSDGTVDYYLDPDDYTKKADGVTASDVANTAYDGNAMMEWGQNGKKIWYKIVPDAGSTKSASVYIADEQVDNSYKAYSFINNQGSLVDHFYTPIYNGSVVSNKMRSISGQQISNKTTATQEVTYAKANNAGNDVLWNTEVLADRILINLLLILMGKSLDTQTVFGQGAHTSGTEAINNTFRSGVHNTKGLFYGTNAGTVASNSFENCVKIFGMENWYGFQWRRIAGWINDNGTQKIKLTYGTEDGSTANAYNETGNGYISIGATPSGTSGGYVNEMQFDEYGMFPKVASGSDSTYYCDGLWFNNSQVNYARVGGGSADGLHVGAFCAGLNTAASYSGWNSGAALSCKPLAGG